MLECFHNKKCCWYFRDLPLKKKTQDCSYLRSSHDSNIGTFKLERGMQVTVFLDVMLCSLVERYQHYGGTYCIHLQESRSGHHVLPNNSTYLPNREHHIPRPQIFILIDMRTSSHIQKIRECCCGGLGWNYIHASSIRNWNGSKII
jgi:hypothetical protein